MPYLSSPPTGGDSLFKPAQPPRLGKRARRLGVGLITSLVATAGVSGLAAAGASAASTVTGSVTVPAGVNSHDVRALLLDSNGSRVTAVDVVAGTSTSTGTYTFDNVANGNYKIYLIDRTGTDDVQAAYYGGATSFASAGTVAVAANDVLSPVTLGSGGAISGSITQPNANVTGTSVEACLVGTPDPAQSIYWNATIDGQVCSPGTVSGNTYAVGGLVPGDTYQLLYTFGESSMDLVTAVGTPTWSDTAYIDNGLVTLNPGSASLIAPVTGAATPVNFTIPAVATVSGTVTNPGGVVNASYNVDLIDGAGSEDSGNTTLSNGGYTIGGVLPGSYKVEFVPTSPLLATQYYDNSATLGGASSITVGAGSVMTGINATLTSAATVSGTVTAAQGGAALGGIEVEAVDADGNQIGSTFTSANGSYVLTGLPAGPWYLRFDGGQAYSGLYYATEYYGGSNTLAGSVAVTLMPGEALVDANQALTVQSTVRPGPPTVASGKLSGLYNNKVALSFKLTAGSGTAGYLKSFRIKLPKNVSWNKTGIKKDLVIAHDTYTEVIKSGQLVVTFPSGKKTVTVQIKAGGVTVTKSIEALAAAHKIASYGIDVSASDTTGLTTSLSYTVKKPH